MLYCVAMKTPSPPPEASRIKSLGAALVDLNFAGGERGEHDAIALDVSELGIQSMLGEQA